MKGMVIMQYSYQSKCVHSGIWEDKCIMAHQNAMREPIFALIIDLQPCQSLAYSPKACCGLG